MRQMVIVVLGLVGLVGAKDVGAAMVADTILLPEPSFKGKVTVEEALKARRSIRDFQDEPLELAQVAQLLWAAYGVTKPLPGRELRGGLRTAPSAGALYPLEIYLVAGKVTGLGPGVFRYLSERHALVKLAEGDRRKELAAAAWGQDMIARAPAVIVYSAVFERNTRKYGQRGRERFVCMDLGHSAENVYLQAVALGLGTCAVGAFEDSSVKRVIGMTKPEEPLYLMPVGRPRRTEF
ncbi:MAG: SagB/ThcOx family dehydrogenase [candidate division WOR-3 bacterium]